MIPTDLPHERVIPALVLKCTTGMKKKHEGLQKFGFPPIFKQPKVVFKMSKRRKKRNKKLTRWRFKKQKGGKREENRIKSSSYGNIQYIYTAFIVS